MFTVGILGIFHSLLLFINLVFSIRDIITLSLICLSIESLPNVSFLFIVNFFLSLVCISLQCLHSTEFSFVFSYCSKCYFPLVYPFSPVSPQYTPLFLQVGSHSIVYVMFAMSHCPLPSLLHIITTTYNKILDSQKRALRIVTPNDTVPSVPGPLYPTDPLFYKLVILKDVFKLQVSTFIFNCLQLNAPTIFHNWFRLNYTIHNYNTRSTFFDIDNVINSNNLFIINDRTTHYGLKLLNVSGPKIWNLIPNQIRNNQSVCFFKRYLKNHPIAQYAS